MWSPIRFRPGILVGIRQQLRHQEYLNLTLESKIKMYHEFWQKAESRLSDVMKWLGLKCGNYHMFEMYLRIRPETGFIEGDGI